MEVVKVSGKESNSQILIGEKLGNLHKYIPHSNTFIITDENVDSIYRKLFPILPVFVMNAGEASKNLSTVAEIYRWLLDQGADRNSFIVGIGGGVVCDLAGFVASTFMRGVNFGFVATTLLAQVDASVGGKNGVDLDGFKNIVGTFNQPKFVICDITMLKTLPQVELANGLAEVVKHALIDDISKFEYIEKNYESILAFNLEMLEYLVTRSVKIKARIVEIDEREGGLRRVLNLGHTWGHAVEKITGIPHGQAVSIGLVFSAKLSFNKGMLSEAERDRIINLLSKLGLHIHSNADNTKVLETLQKDKKKIGNGVHYVLMKGIGEVEVVDISFDELRKYIV
ncbi:MAG: 3-dehydroquinate synthase [Bacteroidales bacterium]|nr:MAG: 3-dehydroquinate synthase [Bacteroidales bacterium]